MHFNIKLFITLILLTLPLTTANQTTINVGIHLLNLGKYEISTGSFTADFYLSFTCNHSCSDDFEFVNGRATHIDKIIDEPNQKFFRIQANLASPVDLKKYPFDQQKITIIIEDKKKTINQLLYVPNNTESGIDNSLTFYGWNIHNWSAYEKKHHYDTYNETFSQYVFELSISRIIINSIFKILLPIIFIVLIMLSSFILNPDKITTRLTMVGSSLVASVMFHTSLTNQIPPVSYLTFIDKFMILTYFILLLSFIFNVILLEITERKNKKLVKKLHTATEFTMFIIVPLLYTCLFLFFH